MGPHSASQRSRGELQRAPRAPYAPRSYSDALGTGDSAEVAHRSARGAGARARSQLGRGRRPFAATSLSQLPDSDAQSEVLPRLVGAGDRLQPPPGPGKCESNVPAAHLFAGEDSVQSFLLSVLRIRNPCGTPRGDLLAPAGRAPPGPRGRAAEALAWRANIANPYSTDASFDDRDAAAERLDRGAARAALRAALRRTLRTERAAPAKAPPPFPAERDQPTLPIPCA